MIRVMMFECVVISRAITLLSLAPLPTPVMTHAARTFNINYRPNEIMQKKLALQVKPRKY